MKRLLTRITFASALLLGLINAQQVPPLGGDDIYGGRFLQGNRGGQQPQQKGGAPSHSGYAVLHTGVPPQHSGRPSGQPEPRPSHDKSRPLATVSTAEGSGLRNLKGGNNKGQEGQKILQTGTRPIQDGSRPVPSGSGHLEDKGKDGKHLRGENRGPNPSFTGVKPSRNPSEMKPTGLPSGQAGRNGNRHLGGNQRNEGAFTGTRPIQTGTRPIHTGTRPVQTGTRPIPTGTWVPDHTHIPGQSRPIPTGTGVLNKQGGNQKNDKRAGHRLLWNLSPPAQI
eukprot:403351074